eukprot:TRINITY_DN7505_c0_g1_i1.p2 TRINITY_DN7505_c0_g1~~TRINITY_DN7505_c0_g1_i1.p2  ORF type:complete len:961 (+),score=592.59 TRINITY_DN7505_c0_g1_i1:68-2884(+)
MQNGIVKEVVSGDTLVVMGRAAGGPPPVMSVTLAGITAPRLGRRDGTSPDEPWAWAAREALRRACVGRQVAFKVEGGGGKPGAEGQRAPRTFARVQLAAAASADQPRDLSLLQVQAGMARAKPARRNEEEDDQSLSSILLAAEETAKAAGEGVWSSDPQAVADAVRDTSASALTGAEHFAKHGKDLVRGVVEYVISGHMMRVTLLPDHANVMIALSGVTCPPAGNATNPPAAFGAEAKFFTECRVLSRDVGVTLEGVDRNGGLFGTVRYDGGNIAEDILRAGLGKVASWSIGSCGAAAALRAAEKEARDARVRVWHGYEPAAPTVNAPTGNAREFEARVVEVVSGDTIVVASGPAGTEQQIRLTNIRVPRLGRRDERPAPLAREAREFVRKRLVGRKVKVFVDYVKPGDEGYPARTCAVVTTDKGVNIGESLVKSGLATVAKLRADHEERSSCYDNLLTAEANAVESKHGLHATTVATPSHINDLTTPAKAQALLGSLQRAPACAAVVEHVFGPARLKMLLPRQSVLALVALAGVRAPRYEQNCKACKMCPACARKANSGGAAKDDAPKRGGLMDARCAGCDECASCAAARAGHVMARNAVLQREVSLEVLSCDRSGAFGSVVDVPGVGNLAVALCRMGLATTAYADSLRCSSELYAAEEEAKQRRIGVWKGWVEPVEEAADAAGAASGGADGSGAPADKPPVTVHPVEIVGATTFVAHVIPDGSTAAGVEQRIKAATKGTGKSTAPAKWRKNLHVVAPFEGASYRAKITAVSGSGEQCEVVFIDYGNKDVVESSDLEPLDPASLTQLPAQALTVSLAAVKPAPEVEDGLAAEAAGMLGRLVFGKNVSLVITHRPEAGFASGIVSDTESGLCVNNAMVRAGLAIIAAAGGRGGRGGGQRKSAQPQSAFAKSLAEDQEIARQGRLNAWKYGDIDDDEEA